jgi:hypothetical protein
MRENGPFDVRFVPLAAIADDVAVPSFGPRLLIGPHRVAQVEC